MTSLRRKPISFGGRRNTIEQERESFLKSQEASFRKAINDDEVPIKMKHVRNLIIGTHTDHNGSVFWDLVALSPPLHTDITAWKFCHTLHLILRDGHSLALRDSIKHIGRVRNLGEHFKHLPSGYGLLIEKYCALLVSKLQFHEHYPKFPGTLQISKEELHSIAENDPNSYFEMAVEVLEYMEKILNLYEAVFHSLDPSRSNSMTKTGQCRLSPLIPSIQDSSLLYDLMVRLLFRLHKDISSDMLSGHRMRFNQQFKVLQSFYNNTRNLQYFKSLIQVPHLPQVPPNFMIQAELRSHVTPVVVIEEEEQADPHGNSSILVDTTDPSPPPVPPHPHPDVVNSQNSSALELLADRESLIEALQRELREQNNLIQTLRSEHSYENSQLKFKVSELESTIAEMESELSAEKESKESVLAQVEASAVNAEAASRLSEEENRRRSAEDKFVKMKEVYQKLRDEHIGLIRMKAELEKSLLEEKRKLTLEIDKNAETEKNLYRLKLDLTQQEDLKEQNNFISVEKTALEKQLNLLLEEKIKLVESNNALEDALEKTKEKIEHLNKDARDELSNAQKTLLSKCLELALDSSTSFIKFSLSHFDNELHHLIKSTPEYTLLYRDPILRILEDLMSEFQFYTAESPNAQVSPNTESSIIIRSSTNFGCFIAQFLLYAKGTAHASPHIDIAESLVPSLESFGEIAIDMLDKIRKRTLSEEDMALITKKFNICCDLVRKCEDLTPTREDMAGILEKEIEAMNDAIAEAVEKFSRLLEESRAKDTGMQLEVNEKILAACSDLMAAVLLLVQRATELQKEIVAAGRGGASPKDFYKRNHRWTEGLISGAKAVGIACQALVQAADDVIGGRGKFEHVIVASREIAACSMQLVMSSRVKADKDSAKLHNLNAAAKSISTLTASVVATAESCREKVSEAATTLDFSKLSLHSMKKLEMETLVKVLETEKLLETEREKLGELRRYHYQLAGDIEGLDNGEEIPK